MIKLMSIIMKGELFVTIFNACYGNVTTQS